MDISNKSLKMLCRGFALGIASDLHPEGKFNFLQNIRVYTEGILESRPRLNTFLAFDRINTGEVPHSMKTIINEINNSFNRVVGVGTKIFTGNGVLLAEKDNGYSGNPLMMIDFRPEAAVQAYVYIADENKFRKISVDNVASDVGIDVPTKAATWSIGKPERKTIDSIEAGSETDWNHLTGTATAPTLETRVNTAILAYLPDGAAPNFASVIPTAFTQDIQRGSILKLNGAQEVVVEDVLPAALNVGVATIAKISYDAGATGMATIVLSIPSSSIKRDSVLLLGGTEYVRVQDVTLDDNGIPSIRVSTVGTFAATNTISGIASFRIYATVGYAAGNTIIGKYIKSVITAAGISSITRTFNVDLTNTAAKAITLDDILHISVQVSNPAALIELQIQLDVNSGAQDFLQNYFYYVVNPNFFTGSASQTTPTISVIQQNLQRQQLLNEQRFLSRDMHTNPYLDQLNVYERNYPDTIPDSPGSDVETTLGRTQWKELEIPLRDLVAFRVGADSSRTLKDIKAIRISVNANAAIDISIDSIWVGGADALTTNEQGFLPYNYVWRVRNPATKEPSNWSPPLRTGIKISRGKVALAFPDAVANYPAAYKIDIARFGGSLNDYRIVGSVKNDGSSYTDTSSDRLIADNELAGRLEGNVNAVFDFFKPFAILDTTKVGTCNVVGTTFTWISGDKLNTTYPRGTQILINGKTNNFYSNPTSTTTLDAATKVELETDLGNLAAVDFEVKDPLLTGQPLPVVFGSFGEGNFGNFFFGLGHKKAAGTLYWLDGNSPGTMSDLNNVEITSPSEPLMSGVIYDGLPYVWSIEKSYQILPTFDGVQFKFIARENANSRGLYSRYAIFAGRNYIYHLTENADGIVRVAGNGNPESITAGVLDNLFYNNGKAPKSITLVDGTIIYPPDFTLKSDLRIFGSKDYVFFRFVDTIGKHRTLVFDETMNEWISYDAYKDDKINIVYYEEQKSSTILLAGIPDGIAKFENAGNYEDLIKSKIVPFAFDAGDSNLVKEFKEEVVKADQGLTGFSVKNYYDDGVITKPAEIIDGNGLHFKQKFSLNLQEDIDGVGINAFNVTSIYEWLLISDTKLYEEIFYWIPQGNEVTTRSGDIEFSSDVGAKLWQGVVIQANTYGQNKILNYYDDRNVLKATIVINHKGKQTIGYSFPNPFISHSIRRSTNDEIPWISFIETYITDAEPEAAKVWEGEFNTSNLTGLIQIQRMAIAYRSNEITSLKLNFDDGTTQEYFLPNSNGDWKKYFFYVEAKKWKACKYRLESAKDIRLYRKPSEIWMKSFNSPQPFAAIQAFGGNSNQSDILI